MTKSHDEMRVGRSLDVPSAILWASAFLLAAAIIVIAGWQQPAATAGEAIKSTPITAVALTTRRDNDMLVVLDERRAELFVYEGYQRGELQILDVRQLAEFFPESEQE